jgi:hypothetical protein
LVVNVIAMNGDLVARLPVANGTTNAKNNTGTIGADNVIVEVVALGP